MRREILRLGERGLEVGRGCLEVGNVRFGGWFKRGLEVGEIEVWRVRIKINRLISGSAGFRSVQFCRRQAE